MNAHDYGRYLYLYRRHLSVYHGNVDHVYKYDLSFLVDEQYGNPICMKCGEVVTDGADWYPEEAEKLALELAERRSSTGYWVQSLANHKEAIRWTHDFNAHGELECIEDGWVEKRAWQIDSVRRLAEGGEWQLWSTYEERPVGATFRITVGGQTVESQPFNAEDLAALGEVAMDTEALEEWAAEREVGTDAPLWAEPPPVSDVQSVRFTSSGVQTIPWASSGTHQEREPAPLFVLLIEPEHPDSPGTYEDGMPLKVSLSDGMCYEVTLNGPSVRLSDGSILTVRAGEWDGHVEAIITGKEVTDGEEAQNAPRRVAWRSRREHRQGEADHGAEGAADV